ncbi:MAG: msbA2 [Candidatus Saccharibacteria bacterium]|nr:msbA2 [Candidatus Saccharibacteria bacterium]
MMTKLSQRERLRAIFKVAKMTYQTAPGAVFVQVFTSVFNAVLPIVLTFFAAATTTALAEAFNGDESAGQRVLLFVILTAVLGVFSSAWSTIENYIGQLLRYKIEASISDHMYEHFLRLDFWHYDDKETIDTYDKASQFARFFPYVFSRLADAFSQLIALIAGLVALVFVSWWLGLILIAAVIPGLIIQFRLSRAQIKHWNSNVDTRRSIGIIEWSLLQPQHMAELRLYSMARYLLDLRSKLRDKDDKKRIEFERAFIFKRLGANTLEAAAEVIALIWTALQIIGHAFPIGYFIYVQQVVSRALGGANSFVSSINNLDEDLSNLVEYQRFIELPESGTGTKRFRGTVQTISIENVSFTYPQAKAQVLDGVSFAIDKGQHVAIVGENGAGKSTLIKLITGLYQPTSGSILLDGTPLGEYEVDSWHRHLAVLQQDYLAFGFATAKENIYYGDVSHPLDSSRFDSAVDMAEARKFLEKLPNGLDSYVSPWMEDDDGNKGVDLSGGQWQRLALARNFYRDSGIIILDEPTSAIDALAESRIFKHLFQSKDKTIITISHRLTTVKKADVIYMMKDGKLAESGTYDELVAHKGAFYKMFESQL